MSLALSIKIGEVVKIGDAFISVVKHPSGNSLQYRLLIDAPKEVRVVRTNLKLPKDVKNGSEKKHV